MCAYACFRNKVTYLSYHNYILFYAPQIKLTALNIMPTMSSILNENYACFTCVY